MVAALLVIPLLLRGSDLACPGHGKHEAGVASPVATESSEGHQHHHDDSGQHPAPTHHSPASDCCPAMNSCTGGVAIHATEAQIAAWSWDAVPIADVLTPSTSRVESPDPPPPKA